MNLEQASKDDLLKLAEALNILSEKKKYNKLDFVYPDEGPILPGCVLSIARANYPKHLAFFAAGKLFKERALIAANRTGKTLAASVEMAYHLTGRYPKWWVGRKFYHPVKAWSVGKTHDTTRDILQNYLLGNRYEIGTGLIPKELLIKTTTKQGTSEGIQTAYCKHFTNNIEDGLSEVGFKSYVQGVEAFMGTAQHVIHLDEEPPNPGMYTECLMRTMTTEGLIMCTFTPTMGLSETVLSFIPGGRFPVGGVGEVEGNV